MISTKFTGLKPFPAIIALAAFGAMTLSCTPDPQYKINEIDTDVTLFSGGVTVPVGSTKKITLDNLTGLSGDSGSIIRQHEDGTYWIEMSAANLAAKDILIPSPEFPAFDLGEEQIPARFDFPENVVGRVSPSWYTAELPLEASVPIKVMTSIPAGICGLDRLELEARLGFTFECARGSAYYILKGATLEFPSYLTLEAADDNVSVTGGHTVTVLKDLKVCPAAGFTLIIKSIDFTAKNMISGTEGNLVVSVDDYVAVKGTASVRGEDFGTVPEGFDIKVSVTSDRITVKGITGRFDFSESIPDCEVRITGMPDYISDADILLYDPVFTATVQNGTPLAIGVSADLVCVSKSSSNRFSINHSLAPEATSAYRLEGENAKKLISKIPDTIKLENIKAGTDRNTTVSIETETNCMVAVTEYSFLAPLAFAEGAGVHLQTALEDASSYMSYLDFAGGAARLEFDLTNTLPMNLKIAASPVNGSGNAVPGIGIRISETIKAGSIDSPSSTPVMLEISCEEGADVSEVSEIRLDITAEVPASGAGATICKDNYIKLDNIRLTFPNGINPSSL